jgi:hypothetical protein
MCDHSSFPCVFSTSYGHSHLTALPRKHWPIATTMIHHTMSPVRFFFMRICVLRVPNMINYTFFSTLPAFQWTATTVPASKKQGLMSMAVYWAAIITAHGRPLRPQAKKWRYNQCVCWFALAWRHPPCGSLDCWHSFMLLWTQGGWVYFLCPVPSSACRP